MATLPEIVIGRTLAEAHKSESMPLAIAPRQGRFDSVNLAD